MTNDDDDIENSNGGTREKLFCKYVNGIQTKDRADVARMWTVAKGARDAVQPKDYCAKDTLRDI